MVAVCRLGGSPPCSKRRSHPLRFGDGLRLGAGNEVGDRGRQRIEPIADELVQRGRHREILVRLEPHAAPLERASELEREARVPSGGLVQAMKHGTGVGGADLIHDDPVERSDR